LKSVRSEVHAHDRHCQSSDHQKTLNSIGYTIASVMLMYYPFYPIHIRLDTQLAATTAFPAATLWKNSRTNERENVAIPRPPNPNQNFENYCTAHLFVKGPLMSSYVLR
jgi:hypothetical protein